MSTWPADPQGDMVPILEASVEAAKKRHPSGNSSVQGVILTAVDRCDGCGAGAVYRVSHVRWDGDLASEFKTLDFCGHHWRKNFPTMVDKGWVVNGTNPDLLGAEDRLKGSDH
jgi:hypothetical protein